VTNAFGLLAGVVGVAGYAPYIRDIVRHKTKPDRAAWLIWALEYSGLFLAQAAQGAKGLLWLVGLQLLGVLVVFGLSWRYGMGRLDARKKMLLVCVLVTLVLWRLTDNASTAIILLLLVELSGVALTAKKTYHHPKSETLTMWWLTGLAGALALLGVQKDATGMVYVYPVVLIIMSLSIVAASWKGARRLRWRAPVQVIRPT
jgi:hypothetical protein